MIFLKTAKRKFNQNGQYMVEYMLLFAMVVVVLLAALGPKRFMANTLNESLQDSVHVIDRVADSIDTARFQ